MKKLFLTVILCAVTLFGCNEDTPELNRQVVAESTDTEVMPAETIENIYTETETEYEKPPIMNPPTLVFSSVHEMKDKLENRALTESEFLTTTNDGSEAYDCDTSLLYELTGIGDYTESSLEWYGGNSYCITYANPDGELLAFMPYIDEEKFNEDINSYRDIGYADSWNEFTDENSGYSYVVAECYTKDGEFLHAILYCSADDVCFKCSYSVSDISVDDIINWRAVIVE